MFLEIFSKLLFVSLEFIILIECAGGHLLRLDVDNVDEEEHGDKGGVASLKEKGSDKDRKIRRAAQRGKLKTKPAF